MLTSWKRYALLYEGMEKEFTLSRKVEGGRLYVMEQSDYYMCSYPAAHTK